MELIPEWRVVLRKAWSVRLMILAGLLTGAEFVLPMFAHALPHGIFSALSFFTVSGALVARLVAQKV